MKLLTCDIGSTNLKLQTFSVDEEKSPPRPVGKTRIITHEQKWLKTDRPLETLSQWLSETANLIVQAYGNEVDAMGFSTYREGLIGLSSTNQVVFAGTNLQPMPLGSPEDVFVMTTFAGWMCWKLTGQCRVTAGQEDAGAVYISRSSKARPRWASLVAAGQNLQPEATSPFGVYLGGTDEQLGYVGTDLSDTQEPRLVIATGTFWSTSSIASGPSKEGVRRTKGVTPFRSVDSCVLYKWGPMIQALSDGQGRRTSVEVVPDRFFGNASTLWFSKGGSVAATRRAAIDDLKAACAMFLPKMGAKVVVYGGGARSHYARELIHEACNELDLVFMDGDATLLGCAIVGRNMFQKHTRLRTNEYS